MIELDFIFDSKEDHDAEWVAEQFARAGAIRLSETRGVIELLYARNGRSLLVIVEMRPFDMTKYRAYVGLWHGRAERMITYLLEICDLAQRVDARLYDSKLMNYVSEYTVDKLVSIYASYPGKVQNYTKQKLVSRLRKRQDDCWHSI